MTSILGTTSASVIGANSSAAQPSWLADAFTAIQNQSNQGGLLGLLSAAASNDGSLNSWLTQSSAFSNSLATISQNNTTSLSALIAKKATANQQAAQQKKLQDALTDLQNTQSQVQPKNTLDPVIYLSDGSTIDTNSNIMTSADGSQYDITTGAKYTDPASIVQLANGAYLDTTNNILTMPDGTRIDSVTGVNLSTTA